MQYQAFDGKTYELAPWIGQNVALLIPLATVADPNVMTKLLAAFDAGYEYYQELTGQHPADWGPTTLNGRTTIAVVDATCGAGCGYLGTRGIEILPDWFGSNLEGDFPSARGFYDAMAENGSTTSIVFYELGRNFWFYGNQLGDYGFTTGYAVVNRHYARESAGVALDPQDTSGAYHNVSLPVIAATYFASQGTTALNTLGNNQGIVNPSGSNGSADLAAALLRIFHDHAGADTYARFWQTLPGAPAAATAAQAFQNFATTAQKASGFDFSFLFKSGWSFKVGGASNEVLSAATSASGKHAVLGFSGNDTLNGTSNTDMLVGDFGNDSLYGFSGNDQLLGGPGHDLLNGGTGADLLGGSSGDDRYYVDHASDKVSEGKGDGKDTIFTSVNYTLSSNAQVEVLATASSSGKTNLNLTGNSLGNTISGNAGTNRIAGKAGSDVLTGGGGPDAFIFDTAPNKNTNVDTIKDFVVKADKFWLDDAVYNGVGSSSALKTGAFWIGAKAHDPSDRIIYDSNTGALYYDADGNGASAQIKFAQLAKGLKLTPDDFRIF